jgi:hypothetical protein
MDLDCFSELYLQLLQLSALREVTLFPAKRIEKIT